MLHIGKHRVGRLYIGPKPVLLLYRGAVRIWQAIRSCFGSGRWLNSRPWINADRWKNTP